MQLRTVLGTTFLLMATAVLASAQGVKPSAPPPTVARVVTATVKTRTVTSLSKTDDERVAAVFRPAYGTYKKDKDARKLMKAATGLGRDARYAYIEGAIGVIASASKIATRYTIESARLNSIVSEAPGPNGCDVRAELALGVRRLGPVPQGTPVLIAGLVEQLPTPVVPGAQPLPIPPAVPFGAVVVESSASPVTEVVVPIAFNNHSPFGVTCRKEGFSAELGVVGGLGQSYRLTLEDGALLLELQVPPPPLPCPVRCSDGRCVPWTLFCE